MCAASSVSAAGPSATIRPAFMSAIRGKKFAARARSWSTATIVRSSRSFRSASRLDHLDLVADVEVSGRLVEEGERCRLSKRQRDEDQLPLAQREASGITVAEMGDTDPFHGRLDRIPILLDREPPIGGSCGKRPRATTSWTGIANGSVVSSGTTAIVRATVL